MIELSRDQLASLSRWFVPERPALMALHVLNSGYGACFADRWPEPRALLVTIGSICSLLGDPAALVPADLRRATGLIYFPPAFLPLVQAAFPQLRPIDRVFFDLDHKPIAVPTAGFPIRRLQRGDANHLANLSPDCAFVTATWGGPVGLAASGYAWGAFSRGTLAAVACTFFLGNQTEDVGVATEHAYRGRGLASAASARLCHDILGRGRVPTWTTSTDNPASIRVAEKLGFAPAGAEQLYVLGPPAAP
jgi:RimJ/RimL family protein N-acetyltransferase